MSPSSSSEKLAHEYGHPWPIHTRYFAPQTMDADAALNLIRVDAKFDDDSMASVVPLRCIDLANNGFVSTANLDVEDPGFISALDLSALSQDSLRVLFVTHRRRYFQNATHVSIRMPLTTWEGILTTCMVPPTALELMHENNGGCLQHVSYCNDNPASPCASPFTDAKPCAYHASFKLCAWNYEHFVYARYDFHSRTAFIMVTGTTCDVQADRILSQFSGQRNIDFHAVLQALASIWVQEIENMRWQLDYATQKFETLTGVSAPRYGIKPLPREKLRLRTDMAESQDSLRLISRVSSHMAEMFQFLQDSLWRFNELRDEHAPVPVPKQYSRQLSDVLQMRISKQHSQMAQIESLMQRVTAQWNIVNAVILHYNNDLNIGMARDSRADTILMRRIAFVTIAFLPATFMSTFFSMIFFHADDGGENITVSRWIWLYFVLTVAFTLPLAWYYTPWNKLLKRLPGVRRRRSHDEKPDDGLSESY